MSEATTSWNSPPRSVRSWRCRSTASERPPPVRPSSLRTCTPSSSPCERCAMRAARRISASVPGAPVIATSTRSRVSHGSVMLLPLAVALEPFVDPVGEPQQRELAQRGEVAGPEVVRERGVDPIRLVDVAVRHAPPQRLRRHVDELDLVGAAHDAVGNRLPLLHAGDALDHVVDRLEVLDVQRRDHVDAGVEELLDVLPPLLVARRRECWCARARRRARTSGRRASTASTSISSNSVSRYSILRRGTTSRSPSCSAVRARPWVSTMPTTTSVPRSWRRRPSLSIANVLPTPGAAPRYKRSWPRAMRPV